MFADPVQNGSFFGRQDNLELMKKRIEGLKKGCRQNVALLGQELIGKSSLLLHLLHEIESDNEILPIYLPLRHESLQKFADRFTGALLYYYFKKEDHDVSGSTDDLLKRGEGRLPRTVEEILRIRKLFGRKSRDHILSLLFDLLPVLCEEGKRFCVMILDEFQELGVLRVRNPFGILGEKIMTQKRIMYIVASSRIRRASEILNNDLSLLFGSFQVDNLGPFDGDKSLAFVSAKLGEFSVNKPAVRFLVTITNGHPFYLDTLCREIEDTMNTRGVSEADQSVISEGISRGLSCPRSITYQYLNNLVQRSVGGQSSQDLEMLLAIAGGNKKSSQIARAISRSPAQTTRRLERLVNTDIIFRSGKVYDFSDALLKWWLRSVYDARENAVEPVVEGKGEVALQAKLEEMMSSYTRSARTGMGERLRSLFDLFKNDVVNVAGKTVKLPRFREISPRMVRGQELPVVCSTRSGYWIADFVEKVLSENEVRAFLNKLSGFRKKTSARILVCISQIEEDARLLAKEEGIWIWNMRDLNFLLELYEQPKVFG
jgi:DNA-binding Lrp family transcriptional regulator